jgi:hypothetical protein
MKNTKAIATLIIGEEYVAQWKNRCQANWQRYAEKHGYDVVCFDQPLDTCARAQSRSAAWQKCLILSQPSLQHYERVVWLDSDILINDRNAPDVAEGVPLDKVGVVEEAEFSQLEPVTAHRFMERALKFWPGAVINFTPREYYAKFGLPGGCDRVANTGVMVLSPRHHRTILEKVYYSYEEKGGREWHMEMRPLSYELITGGMAHWMDSRFNWNWPFQEIMYYPFLLEPGKSDGFFARLKRKTKAFRWSPLHKLHSYCLNAAFQFSFFLHFGGPNVKEMDLIDQTLATWLDVLA